MPLLSLFERLVIPLAAWLAVAAYTGSQLDPAGRAEGSLLGVLIASIVAAIAAIGSRTPGSRTSPELAATALLATAVVWIAYQGPSRGAVVSLILGLGLGVSTVRALFDNRGRWRVEDRLDPGISVPLAFGYQCLMRCDLLLPPLLEARTLVSLLVLPMLAGGSISVLASRFGTRRAVLAGGLVVVLAPGWTLTSTFALTALAAGTLVTDGAKPSALRWIAIAGLVLLPLWNLPKGLLLLLAALAVTGQAFAPMPLLTVAAALVAIMSPQLQSPMVALRTWAGAVLLVPAAIMAPAAGRWQMRLGAILALAAALVSSYSEAMAAGVALAALGTPIRGAVATLQRAWCATLVIGTALISAYPWVRQEPRQDLLELLGWHTEAIALLVVVTAVVGLGLLLELGRRFEPRWTPQPGVVAGLLLAIALLLSQGNLRFTLRQGIAPTEVLVNSYGPIALDATTDTWQVTVSESSGSEPPIVALAVDSHLTRSGQLIPGSAVATVELLGDGDQVLAGWPLRTGQETGEWSSARDDVVAPPHWMTRVASEGTFFARSYRAHFETTRPMPVSRLRIRRAEDLPPETALSIVRLEIRR